MEIVVDRPTLADVEEVEKVFFETWLATYPNTALGITEADIRDHFATRSNAENRERRIKQFSQPDPQTCFFVARSGGQVVGVCGGVQTDAYAQLRSIYVLPEYQRKRIGMALWNAFYAWAKPSLKIIVHVATYNTAAIAFYTHLGFIDTGKRFTEERHRLPNGVIIPELEMELLPK